MLQSFSQEDFGFDVAWDLGGLLGLDSLACFEGDL
jgi:hypothetical protein